MTGQEAIDFNRDEFEKALPGLLETANEHPEKVKDEVMKIVKTYHPT